MANTSKLTLVLLVAALTGCSIDSLTKQDASLGTQQAVGDGITQVNGSNVQLRTRGGLNLELDKQEIAKGLQEHRKKLTKQGYKIAATSSSAARIRVRITFLEGAIVVDPGLPNVWNQASGRPGPRTVYFGVTRSNTRTGYFPWTATNQKGVTTIERLIYADNKISLAEDPIFPGANDPTDPQRSPIMGRVLVREHRDSTVLLPAPIRYLSIFGGGLDDNNLTSTCGGSITNCRGGSGAGVNLLPPRVAPYIAPTNNQAAGFGSGGTVAGPNVQAPGKLETFTFASKEDMPGSDGFLFDIVAQAYGKMFSNANTVYDHPLSSAAMAVPLVALDNMYSRTHVYDFTANDAGTPGVPGTRAVTTLAAPDTLEGIPSDWQAPPGGPGLPFGRAIVDVRVADINGNLIQWASKTVEFIQGGTNISFASNLTNVGDPSTPLGITF